MQRYNVFYQVHKGLREMLYQTASLLQHTDFINAEESETALQKVAEVMDIFDKHAHTEDNFVLPTIGLHDASVTGLFAEEHVEDHILSNRMRALLGMFHETTIDEEKIQMGSAIRFAFVDFLVFNLKHMAKEEDVLNNLLWKTYTDEQIHGITQKILAHIVPGDMAVFSRWMMLGLSNNEIIQWLKEVKNNAPGFVFAGMLALAEKELSCNRWAAVQEGITEGAMLA
jgi:hypothetical protein